MDSKVSVDYAIHRWVKWGRSSDMGLGYASKTMEGKMADGELPGISGSGQYNPPEDAVAEMVERAICSLTRHNAIAARVFVERNILRTPYRKLSAKVGVAVRKVERLEDEAYGYIAGQINSE